MRTRAPAWLLVTLALAGFLLTTGCGSSISNSESARAPRIAPTGTWADENGAPLALESFRGGPVVFSAFFTSCTVRCPMTFEKLAELDRAFRSHGRRVPFVLLTLDPQTDTQERLARYKQAHNLPEYWHLIHGNLPETRALARYLGVSAAYDDGHIDHDVQIAIFDARGSLAHAFSGWLFDVNAAAVVR